MAWEVKIANEFESEFDALGEALGVEILCEYDCYGGSDRMLFSEQHYGWPLVARALLLAGPRLVSAPA